MSKAMWLEKDWNKHKNKIIAMHVRRDSQESRAKSRSLKIVLKHLKLYCEHTSIVGIKYLANPQKTWWERVLWIVVNSIAIVSLLFVVSSSYQEFVTAPILSSMDSENHPTTDLDFPGIAICPINRISRQAATKMVTEIFDSNVTNLSLDEILTLVWQLGNLYDYEFNVEEDRNDELDQLLRTYHKGDYDITEIMKTISPHCSSVLLKCRLHGEIRNCSELFEFRRTQNGYCCTFNYARESDDIPVVDHSLKPNKVYEVRGIGLNSGLTVLMEPFLEDYFYPMMPVNGWKVVVFNPFDYPDVTTGGLDEIIAMPRAETYIDISMTVFYSTEAILDFPVEKRNCLFPKEKSHEDDGAVYSYSNCILDCKIRDMQRNCGCRPFVYPRRGKRNYSWRVCNNADLGCLMRYKTKWVNVFPHEGSEKYVEDKFWALHCRKCYPSCADTSYHPHSSSSPIIAGRYITDFLSNFTIVDHGIVHVFFSRYGSVRLKQDVVYYWYELMSDIGGICGVFIGFSLISVVELLYFVALAIRDVLFKGSVAHYNVRKNTKARNQPVYAIHWNELLPRPSQKAWNQPYFRNNRAKY